MAILKDRLDAFDGQPEQGWNKRKGISVGERGQVYRANFSHEYLSAVYAIDGGIIKDYNTTKCDKLVLLDLDSQTLFELPFMEADNRIKYECNPSLIFTKLLQKNWNGTLAKFKK